MGELPGNPEGDRECTDCQLWRLRDPVSEANEDLYILAPSDIEFVDRLIEKSVNLVGCIYGKVYFPTFSNSLKEVGRYLGFEWTLSRGSGAAAPLLRRAWELSVDDKYKHELIGYNIDDCRAAATVANALLHICGGDASALDAVNVASLEVVFSEPSANSLAPYRSSQRSIKRLTGTTEVKGIRGTNKTIRRTAQNPKTGAKAQRWNKR